MDKNEVIKGLYQIKNWKCNGDAEMHEVVESAIKLLGHLEEHADKRTETHACDLISRQAAIDAAESAYVRGVFPTPFIREVPPAQPEQRWIPCSERLPEESGYYIVTAHDGTCHRTTFVKYQKKDKSWYLTGARSYWRVIAWMPLPEPYKAEAERRTDG